MPTLNRLLALSALVLSVGSFAAPSIPNSLRGVELASGKEIERTLSASTKPTVIVFVSARCPCSRSHEKELTTLAKDFPGVDFVGINSNVDEGLELSKKHFVESALGFPVLKDPKAEIANSFGALKTPHVFVVDAGGHKILYQGGVTDAHKADDASKHYLREVLKEVAAGRPAPLAESKSLGCYIKRSL
ncbi:MAG: redoxin domain-containing protein [Bdellovibrionales bacterium]|nr:redoxin domain-containing protein [Bdellovibrionales bacterium]